MPTILSERYRLDTLIGGGGMGEVWKAYDEVLGREVAVKVIRPHLAEDATIRERLRTEAQLAGSLHHQGIVDVYDYGEHQEDDGRTTPFLVMPLVDGVSLAAMLKSRTALPVGETMSIITEMANALAVAHAAGIVHRDLKPANIMLSESGRVMILDFGIARSTGGESLTQTGALIGTADYLSPEQAAGKQATYASDLYSLGVVAYTCLTGAPPFHRETDIATALAHVQAPMPELPDELVAAGVGPLIEGLLAKEPGQRPAASEVAAIAAEFATTVPTQVATATDEATDPDATQPGAAGLAVAGPPTVEQAAPTGVAPAADPTAEVGEQPTRRRGVLASLAVLGLIAVAFALFYALRADQIEVPDVRKMTSVEAASTLTKAGFKVKTHDVDAAGFKDGVVATQSPEAGSSAGEGSEVDLGVATGFIAIPKDLVGKPYDDAAKILDKLGLKPQPRYRASSKKAGTVTSVDPSKRARPGDTVVLDVAGRSGGSDSGDDEPEPTATTPAPTPTPTTPKPSPTATATTTAPPDPGTDAGAGTDPNAGNPPPPAG